MLRDVFAAPFGPIIATLSVLAVGAIAFLTVQLCVANFVEPEPGPVYCVTTWSGQ